MKFLDLAKTLLENTEYETLYDEDGEMLVENAGVLSQFPQAWVQHLTRAYSLTVGKDSEVKTSEIKVSNYSAFKKALADAFGVSKAQAWFVSIDGSQAMLLTSSNGYGRPEFSVMYSGGEIHSNKETHYGKGRWVGGKYQNGGTWQSTNTSYNKGEIISIIEAKLQEIAFGAGAVLHVDKRTQQPDTLTNHPYAKMSYDSEYSRGYEVDWKAFFKDHTVEFGAITLDEVRLQTQKSRKANRPGEDDLEDIRSATLHRINDTGNHLYQEAMDELKRWVNSLDYNALADRTTPRKFEELRYKVLEAKSNLPVHHWDVENPPRFIDKAYDTGRAKLSWKMAEVMNRVKARQS